MFEVEFPLSDDNENGAISGLPEFECGVFANSYTDACSCCVQVTSNRDPSDLTTVARRRSNCKEEWARRETYWEIRAKVENAVKVTFLKLVERVARRFSSLCVFLGNYILISPYDM